MRNETEPSETASVSITKRTPLSFQCVTPTGPIVSVLDGDTIEVLHHQPHERIRLNGIDCPEKGQPYGHQAEQAMSVLDFGKKSSSRRTAATRLDTPSPMCVCPMGPTSITHSSKTVGAGGTGNSLPGIQN
jgi:endonuclease YncB( thermonuclease family)